jgi:hypothetical protein
MKVAVVQELFEAVLRPLEVHVVQLNLDRNLNYC